MELSLLSHKKHAVLVSVPASASRLYTTGRVLTALSFRCFVCRQSKQQLEEEQKRSLYGLENTGNVSEVDPACAVLYGSEPERLRLPLPMSGRLARLSPELQAAAGGCQVPACGEERMVVAPTGLCIGGPRAFL